MSERYKSNKDWNKKNYLSQMRLIKKKKQDRKTWNKWRKLLIKASARCEQIRAWRKKLTKCNIQIDLVKTINHSKYHESSLMLINDYEKLDDNQVQRHETQDSATSNCTQENQLCDQTQKRTKETATLILSLRSALMLSFKA